MRMKHKMIISMLLVFILLISLLVACVPQENDKSQEYTIQYSDDSGIHNIKVLAGELYHLEQIPQRNGYVFLGLFDAETGGTQYVNAQGGSLSPFTDNRNIVLYPQFRAKEFTLILNYGDAPVTGVRQMTVNYGSTISELPMNLFVANKTFEGWYTQPNRCGIQVADKYGVIPQNSYVTEDIFDLSDSKGFINLYAGFKNEEFLVTFYIDGIREPEEQMIEYGTPISQVVTQTRNADGIGVLTWSKKSDKSEIFNGKITDSMVLYSVEFAPVIDFDTNGGQSVNSIVAKQGTVINLPIPIKTDYVFVGWFTQNGAKYEATAMSNEGIELVAHWNAMLIFNTNGGTAVENISQEMGTTVVLPTTERSGYMFAGWYTTDGTLYTLTAMPKESIKLYAKYYKVKKKKVVIISDTASSGGNGYFGSPDVSVAPNMDMCRDTLDLHELYDANVKSIKIIAHYDVLAQQASSATPLYTRMSWYSEEVASDAYKVWFYEEQHINGSWGTYTNSTTLQLTSPCFFICRHVSNASMVNSSWANYYWSNFWVEIEYPDTSNLYL